MKRSFGARLTGILCIGFLLVGLTGCRSGSLLLRERSDSMSELIVVGDVRSYLDGRADRSRYWQVPPEMFEVAVGIASTDRETDQQATAVLANEVAYVRPQGSPLDVLTIRHIDENIQSSFLVGIPPGRNPTARYRIAAGGRGVRMDRLIREIMRKHGDVVFVVGVADFPYMEGQSLATAPDAGRPLFGMSAPQSFDRPVAGIEAPALFAGPVLREDAAISGMRARVFFHDPARPRPDGELMRLHALVLSSSSDIVNARAGRLRTRALTSIELSPSSRVQSGWIDVYSINRVEARPRD